MTTNVQLEFETILFNYTLLILFFLLYLADFGEGYGERGWISTASPFMILTKCKKRTLDFSSQRSH